ncbi:MAG TPA: hypothetical protein VGM98_18710 [Schlesneria sp.]|jgi:hypothetical protein
MPKTNIPCPRRNCGGRLLVQKVIRARSGEWTRRLKVCSKCGCKRFTLEQLLEANPDEPAPKPKPRKRPPIGKAARRRGMVVV